MMRKIIFFTICIVVLIIASWYVIPACNNKAVVGESDFFIYSVEVQNIPEKYLKKNVNGKSYWNSYWNSAPNEKTIQDILNNTDKYRVLSVKYLVYNKSEETDLNDIRVYLPKKNSNFICYNSGNGDYFIPVHPLSKSGLTQTIIVYSEGKSDDEIIAEFMNQSVELTYYTGDWGYSNGHKLIGMGIHRLKVKACDIYNLE